MKILMAVLLLSSSAFASFLTTQFYKRQREVDVILKDNKLLAEIGELSYALGIQYTVNDAEVSAYLGSKAKTTVPATKNQSTGWYYVDPLLLGKNLGYRLKLEKVTNQKTKALEDVLKIEYAKKIGCNDFKVWEDAQKFFLASSLITATDFEERDPFNLDRGKDGAACENLPRSGR
jgi:hypothetical protein